MDDLAAQVGLLALQGTPFDEIARQLGISEAEVHAALGRGADFARSLPIQPPPELFVSDPRPLDASSVSQTEPRRFESATIGTVPSDGVAVVGGVALPAGHRKAAESTNEDVVWITDPPVEDVGSTWIELARAHSETGLWPFVTTGLFDGSERPWDNGEFEPQPVDGVDASRAVAFLADMWAEGVPEEDDDVIDGIVGPFGVDFPGLAPAALGYHQDAIGSVAHSIAPRRIALIPARRPADVITRLGWFGPINLTNDVAGLSSTLRSWEDRFGAVLVAMSFDEIVLAVQGPPRTISEALPIAAEHYAFCPDEIEQRLGSIRAHAEAITDAVFWHFWWD